ncbi:class I SAM-dependent methyltransferase [Brevundimonas sp.]|uniref:class I SAM-dependent methyltransferase n=1 Tax=Brevundimonas sp. TaxID=1871086 RepID=UPI00286CD6A2|nr:class I SAM-dependent methyltransferase [Brevundimonas sp.]
MTDHPAPPLDHAFWAQKGGDAWLQLQGLMERLYLPISDAILDRLDPPAGARILDVGCGGGATTLALARRLGPDGQAVGVDISQSLLDSARRQASAAGVDNVEFVQADAQQHDFHRNSFDAIISRFGVMFFSDPDAAFANLRRATRYGGILVMVCWRRAEDNPLALLPADAAAPLLSEPPQVTTEGPGRFAFRDPDHVRGILTRSGWRDIDITPLDVSTPLDFDEAMALSTRLGVLATVLPGLDDRLRAQICEAVAARLSDHVQDGVIPMSAACWMIVAQA